MSRSTRSPSDGTESPRNAPERPAQRVPRSDVVQAAKRYLGVPWRHQGRSMRGVDCVGLVYCVARDLGILPHDLEVPPYRRVPDGTFLSYFNAHMVRVPLMDMQPGSVIIMSYRDQPYHAGILLTVNPSSLIHAYARFRKVTVDYLHSSVPGRKLCACYEYKEVCNG